MIHRAQPLGAALLLALLIGVLMLRTGSVVVVRHKLITGPSAPASTASRETPPVGETETRTAVVARLRNDLEAAVTVRVSFDGELVGHALIPSRTERRVDLAARMRPVAGGRLEFRADSDFTLSYLEVSNAHGASRRFVELFVLPSGQAFDHSSLPLIALLILLAAFVATFSPASCPAWVRWVHAAACVLVVTPLGLVLLSPVVSPYLVVLSPRTTALGAAILLARRIATAMRAVGARAAEGPRVAVAATAVLGCAFFASAMLQTLAVYQGNYSGFLHLSRSYVDRLPFLEDRTDLRQRLLTNEFGYDGQFYFGMAFDPLLSAFHDRPQVYDRVADLPPYRYGRAAFSALTRASALGRPELFAPTMVWLVLGSQLLLAAGLGAFARQHGLSPYLALHYVAIPGFMPSLLFALPEAVAAACLVGGVLFWDRDKPLAAAAAFAAASLFRETSLLVVGAFVLVEFSRRRIGRALWLSTAALPALAWRAFVWSRLAPVYGPQAFYHSPGDLGPPLGGLLELVGRALNHTHPSPERMAGLLFPLLLVAISALAIYAAVRRRDALSLAAAGYGLVAVCLNYEKIWSHVPSGERGTYELFLCLLLVGLSDRRLSRIVVVVAGLVAAYTFLAAPEAAMSRAALLLLR